MTYEYLYLDIYVYFSQSIIPIYYFVKLRNCLFISGTIDIVNRLSTYFQYQKIFHSEKAKINNVHNLESI